MTLPPVARDLRRAGNGRRRFWPLAAGINDAFGDYVAGYNGSKLGDLDVLSSIVTYNPSTDKFVFSGTFAADVGTTAGGFYVWA